MEEELKTLKDLDIDGFKNRCLGMSDKQSIIFDFNNCDRKFIVLTKVFYDKLLEISVIKEND